MCSVSSNGLYSQDVATTSGDGLEQVLNSYILYMVLTRLTNKKNLLTELQSMLLIRVHQVLIILR